MHSSGVVVVEEWPGCETHFSDSDAYKHAWLTFDRFDRGPGSHIIHWQTDSADMRGNTGRGAVKTLGTVGFKFNQHSLVTPRRWH
jgi:hypothetical protein